MSFTIGAYSESQDAAGAFVNVTAVPDPSLRVSGDFIYVPETYNKLLGAMACIGTTGVEARLESPKLLSTNPAYVAPIELDIHPGADFHHTVDGKKMLQLVSQENMNCVINANPAAAEQQTIIVFLSDGNTAPVSGEIITVNAIWTGALTAGTWSFAELTLAHELAFGNYDVVGLRAVIDAAVAARFVPLGQANLRPGAPCASDKEVRDPGNTFRYGNLGTWFTFDTNHLPGLEVIGSAAVGSASYEIYLDLIRR